MVRLTRQQVREVDRRAIEEFHIPGVVLMENAARAATQLAGQMLENNCNGDVLILVGGGNNGGDGLAIARHLHNLGAEVRIGLTGDPATLRGEALINWNIVQAMMLDCEQATPDWLEPQRPLLIIDAIFGTGLTQPPREPFPALVRAVHKMHCPVLAIDLPSGMDCDSGLPLGGACITATRTITFVAEKAGFANPASRQFTGPVSVGDIGAPVELIEQVAGT